MVATANSPDEFVEVMGDPCFEMMSSDWMIEQVETVGKLYVGSIDALSDADMKNRLETAFEMGKKLVNEIEKER
jgi:hypothetical protein